MPDQLAVLAALAESKRVRLVLASLCVLLALAFFWFFRYRAGLPSAQVIQENVADATVYYAADRTIVWTGGECITLNWRVEGIREIWLRTNPVTGQEERIWCLRDQALAGRPTLRIHFNDGQWREFAFDIEVMHPLLLYTAVPLLFAAAWIIPIRVTLPSSIRTRLTDERRTTYWFVEPFLKRGSFDLHLIYIFVAINALVLFNAVRHNPQDGYDAHAHLAYVDTLAELRLPERRDTYEFFSPPLTYVLPAAVTRIVDPLVCSRDDERCALAIQKTGQYQNVLLSIGITFLLIKLLSFIHPAAPEIRMLALIVLGILPVYYKTMSFVRGEPFLAFFTVYLTYLITVIFFRRPTPRGYPTVMAGIVMGLLLLSRQWGVFIILAVMIWLGLLALRSRTMAVTAVRTALLSSLIALMVGGWFYWSLQTRFGSVVAFNRSARHESVVDHAPEFYVGLGNGALFTTPFRDAFPDQILPKFYTEIWGDYEGYFVTYQFERPPSYLLEYLGRVNAVSLLPTLLLVGAIGVGTFYLRQWLALPARDLPSATNALLFLCIACSLSGYLWFLIRYPSDRGDTIKATYMLQIFPLIALLGGELLAAIRCRRYSLYVVILAVLGVVVAHNLPAMMTRRTIW